jgi:hypothetical protein
MRQRRLPAVTNASLSDAERVALTSRQCFLLCLYRDLRLTSVRFKITCVISLNPVDFWQLKLSSPDFTRNLLKNTKKFGARARSRTADTRIFSPVLYH